MDQDDISRYSWNAKVNGGSCSPEVKLLREHIARLSNMLRDSVFGGPDKRPSPLDVDAALRRSEDLCKNRMTDAGRVGILRGHQGIHQAVADEL